ncbi:membrane protein [Granulicella aggregans]|uniref:Membrane protein n=1 Tax=Granulicella aggregans TaxID=474949 RepID=A0A7W8E476_9BACT|nr:YihY/virulence factor BrkB family protein [Granulicella aggregans]MBB5056870.1 membrane protein [Granulicella aggregans]
MPHIDPPDPKQDAPRAQPASPQIIDPARLAAARQRTVWAIVSASPIGSLWDLQGTPLFTVVKRTAKSFLADNLLGRAAELGFYFLFALFPTLVSASSLLGLAARSASHIYSTLLAYLSVVIPPSAMGIVLETFNQTTAASSTGKVTFGLVAAIWSASVGFSAIQDTLNLVYKVPETRPYWKARLSAIGVTTALSVLVTGLLASMLGGDMLAAFAHKMIYHHPLAIAAAILSRLVGWIVATALLAIIFAVIYFFAPDVKKSRWHWLSPGAAIGIVAWLLASFALRLYLHFFNNYSVTYGSLGAVIILLTWFYITGVVLLLGAEVNSEIEAAVTERRLCGGTPQTAPTAA